MLWNEPRIAVRLIHENGKGHYLELFVDRHLLKAFEMGFSYVKEVDEQLKISNAVLISVWQNYVIRISRPRWELWRECHRITVIRRPREPNNRKYYLRLKFFPSFQDIVGIEVRHDGSSGDKLVYYIWLTKDQVQELNELMQQHLAGLYQAKEETACTSSE